MSPHLPASAPSRKDQGSQRQVLKPELHSTQVKLLFSLTGKSPDQRCLLHKAEHSPNLSSPPKLIYY